MNHSWEKAKKVILLVICKFGNKSIFYHYNNIKLEGIHINVNRPLHRYLRKTSKDEICKKYYESTKVQI